MSPLVPGICGNGLKLWLQGVSGKGNLRSTAALEHAVLLPIARRAKGVDPGAQRRIPAQLAWRYSRPCRSASQKVKDFSSRDDDLVAQLADYAEKTAQTEARVAALSSPNSSAVSVHSALQGFSLQCGANAQIDRSAPTNQQALALFRLPIRLSPIMIRSRRRGPT